MKYYKGAKGRRLLESHMPNTLDEYCSPTLTLEVLASRNRDQVLGRYKNRSPRKDATQKLLENYKEDDRTFLGDVWTLAVVFHRPSWSRLKETCGRLIWSPVLSYMTKETKRKQPEEIAPPTHAVFVKQMWVWKIGDHVLAPEPYSKNHPGLPNHMSWYDLARDHPSEFIALLLGEVVDRFDTPKPGEETPLRIFENALAIISEEVNIYTESVLIEDIDLAQEKALFHQISDLREELSMVKSVLSQQEEVWNEYTSHMWPTQATDQQQGLRSNTRRARDTDNGTEKNAIPDEQPGRHSSAGDTEKLEMEQNIIRQLSRTRAKFRKYNKRIMTLEENAERVDRNILTKLDLKQKHATMREAHSAAMLSATVFGFTIITVIFAPLSFIAALFALPIDKFNEGKDGNTKDGVYFSNYIGKWSGKLSNNTCAHNINLVLTASPR